MDHLIFEGGGGLEELVCARIFFLTGQCFLLL